MAEYLSHAIQRELTFNLKDSEELDLFDVSK